MPSTSTRPAPEASVPVNAAGCRIEPPVSLAVAARQRSAATAAEEPPDEAASFLERISNWVDENPERVLGELLKAVERWKARRSGDG